MGNHPASAVKVSDLRQMLDSIETEKGKDAKVMILSEEHLNRIVDSAIDKCYRKFEQLHAEAEQERVDKRLFNTRLLLRNYMDLKESVRNAVYERKLEPMGYEELENLMQGRDETVILESIMRSTSRTLGLMERVDVSLAAFKAACESGNDIDKRRYDIIQSMYLVKKGMNQGELAVKYGVSQAQISMDLKAAVNKLSVLIFQMEGIRFK